MLIYKKGKELNKLNMQAVEAAKVKVIIQKLLVN